MYDKEVTILNIKRNAAIELCKVATKEQLNCVLELFIKPTRLEPGLATAESNLVPVERAGKHHKGNHHSPPTLT
jgi:hypothetical protein